MTLDVLQDRIGYRFKDESLLVLAVTHSSWANEHSAGNAHNERLEFLGDAVLEIAVSAQLFARFPDAREGELTRLRSSLVNEATLAVIARKLHLDDCLRLARGEENQGGRQRDSCFRTRWRLFSAAYSWTGGLRRRARSWSGCTQISGPRTPRRYGARISRRSCRRPRSVSARGFPCMRLRTAMVPSTPRFFRPRGSARRASVPRLRPRTQAG